MLFRRNENNAAQNQEDTMNALKETRENAQKMISKLSSINWEKLKNKETIKAARIEIMPQDSVETNEEGVTEYKLIEYTGVAYLDYLRPRVNKLITKLKDQITAEVTAIEAMLDQGSIDSFLLSFTGKFITALDRADLRTANACLSGMIYGVYEGHYPIDDSVSKDEAEDMISERSKKMKIIDALIDNAKHITKLENVRNDMLKQYRVVYPIAAAAQKDFLDFYDKKQGLYEAIEGMSGSQIEKLYGHDERWEAWGLVVYADHMYNTGSNLVTEIKLFESNISQFEIMNINLQNARLLAGVTSDDKLRSKIEEQIMLIPDAMRTIANNAIEADKINRKLTDAYNAALDAEEFKQAHAEAVYYNKERQKIEETRKEQALLDEEALERKREEEAEALEQVALKKEEKKNKMSNANRKKKMKF